MNNMIFICDYIGFHGPSKVFYNSQSSTWYEEIYPGLDYRMMNKEVENLLMYDFIKSKIDNIENIKKFDEKVKSILSE